MTKWGDEETAHLLYLVQVGESSAEIAERFRQEGSERTQRAIEGKIRRGKRNDPGAWREQIRGADTPKYDEEIKITSERFLVIADPHAPFHDAPFLNAAIGIGANAGCDTCIIAGDLIDWSSFCYYGRTLGVEVQDEIKAATRLIHSIAEVFETVIYLPGNHEDRLGRKLDKLLPVSEGMKWFVDQPNVQLTDYHHCEIVSGGKEYYVEHPKNTSVIATRVAQRLCSKYLKNIIMGHNHLWGITRDRSGQFYAIEAGVCADPQKLEYIQKIHNTRPEVNQGAVMVLRGIPVLLSPENVHLYGRIL